MNNTTTEKIYSLGDRHPAIALMQRALNEKLKLKLLTDGVLGKITQDALSQYQNTQNCAESNERGVCYGPRTQAALKPHIEERFLTEQDYVDTAKALDCEVAMVKAVTRTEAKEAGFLSDGFPVILFERHKFYKALEDNRGTEFADKISAMNPGICNKKPGGYKGGDEEVSRLNQALSVDTQAAYASASWGLFQIMGFNFRACGFISLMMFVDAMKTSERNQLLAVEMFIKKSPALLSAIRAKDFKAFARAYNGPNYSLSSPPYDKRLEDNYRFFANPA